ncbi:hypothetical protein OCH239_18635 [Roseivivax halodurans JCM 10272]|uniref:Uncharacterized protein n=1 Tax=Roseivivax halodurans JCM 10272 TaxID=1449350 RepID=X7E850_9RHOB|nr:hypothetical protein OCH239_18635 [Roseivivax halodurans JCM 10272]
MSLDRQQILRASSEIRTSLHGFSMPHRGAVKYATIRRHSCDQEASRILRCIMCFHSLRADQIHVITQSRAARTVTDSCTMILIGNVSEKQYSRKSVD